MVIPPVLPGGPRWDLLRRDWLIVAAIMLFGLALRLFEAWQFNAEHPGGATVLIGDEPGYDNNARAILAGRRIFWPGRVPLYSVWLALVYAGGDGSYESVRYAQAFLG